MLMGILVPVGVAVALARLLRAPDEPHFAGLAAAGIGAIFSWAAGLGLMLAFGALELSDPPPRLLLLLGPVLGEGSRVMWGVRARASFVTGRDWLFFGLGYSLLLFIGQVFGSGFSFSSQSDRFLLIGLATSLFLSTFIGVLTAALLKADWPWWIVLPITTGIGLAAALLGEQMESDAMLADAARVAIAALSLVSVGLLMRFGHRLPSPARSRSHANTAP